MVRSRLDHAEPQGFPIGMIVVAYIGFYEDEVVYGVGRITSRAQHLHGYFSM